MMKPGVCVGLTMKSIDYFCYGLPLINNIPGDTWQLVEEHGIGVNCSEKTLETNAEQIVDRAAELQKKRHLIQKLYELKFTQAAMQQVLKEHVLTLFGKEK